MGATAAMRAVLIDYLGGDEVLSFAGLVVRFWHHNLIDSTDVKWLTQINDVLNNREDKLPEVGRYNAGQKMLFFVLGTAMAVVAIAGVIIVTNAGFDSRLPP